MIQQLAFDLPGERRLTRADFCVSPANTQALAAVDAWRLWPNRKMLLVGPAGSGKSHLAQIWAADADAVLIPAQNLPRTNIAVLAENRAVCIEDADTLAGDPAAEAALFHLHNLLAITGTLLVTAGAPARDWGLTLPDLASRLQATALTRIEPPDDALLAAVLAKLFADRQLVIPASLINFLIARMDRSIAMAQHLVASLDARALELRRPITRQLATEILEISGDP